MLKGRHNLAGEPKYYESMFRYSPSYTDMLWSEKGMLQIARNVALTGISLVSPEAFYFAVDTVDDMDELHNALQARQPAPMASACSHPKALPCWDCPRS